MWAVPDEHWWLASYEKASAKSHSAVQDTLKGRRKSFQAPYAQSGVIEGGPPTIDRATQPQRLSFWQRAGQSVNLAGTGLFMRVLLVSLSLS
jgi:hypothetical protein